MKLALATLALVAGLTAPAFAQTVTDAARQAASQAATQAATQAVTDSINKATGAATEPAKKKGHDKKDPNYGKSDEHRQDGEHGHKGKKKHD